MAARYWPQVLSSGAIVSLSVSLIGHRLQRDQERNRLFAQISVLESAKSALQSPNVDMKEIEKLVKLAGLRKIQVAEIKPPTWREVFMPGSRKIEPMTEEQERKEIHNRKCFPHFGRRESR